jgi:hypothetical protein
MYSFFTTQANPPCVFYKKIVRNLKASMPIPTTTREFHKKEEKNDNNLFTFFGLASYH